MTSSWSRTDADGSRTEQVDHGDGTGTAYTAANADKAKIITRSNGSASTQTWPQDSAAADLAVGAAIEVRNLGAGTVTHQAGTGATVTGSLVQAQHTIRTALKVGANTWHIA